MARTVALPIPYDHDVVSHPLNAYMNSRACERVVGRCICFQSADPYGLFGSDHVNVVAFAVVSVWCVKSFKNVLIFRDNTYGRPGCRPAYTSCNQHPGLRARR